MIELKEAIANSAAAIRQHLVDVGFHDGFKPLSVDWPKARWWADIFDEAIARALAENDEGTMLFQLRTALCAAYSCCQHLSNHACQLEALILTLRQYMVVGAATVLDEFFNYWRDSPAVFKAPDGRPPGSQN